MAFLDFCHRHIAKIIVLQWVTPSLDHVPPVDSQGVTYNK